MAKPIRKISWILVGVFLYGIPIGVIVPMFWAFLKPGSLTEIQPFSQEIFFNKLCVFLPLFLILGMLYGLWMSRLSDKIYK